MNRMMVSPRAWPVGIRRVFILAFPLTVPLWLASLCVLAMCNAVVGIYQPVAMFWNAPAKRVRSDYYGQTYGSRRSPGRELMVVPVKKRRRR